MTVGEAVTGDDSVLRRPPVALLFAITVTGILGNTLIGPAIPTILADFGRSDSAAGVLVAVGSLPGILVAPAIGLAADRFGRRAVLVPCLVIFGLAGPAAGTAPTFELLLAARLLQGVGSAGLINLAVVLIGDHWEGTERTRIIGRNAAVLTLGLAVVPPVGGVLTDLVGWRWALSVYGIALLTALGVVRWLDANRPVEPAPLFTQIRAARTTLETPIIAATIGSGVVVFLLIFGAFLAAFPVYLEDDFNLGATARGFVIAVPAASSSLVAFNLGRIRERFGQRIMLLAASSTYVMAFAAIAVAPSIGLVLAGTIVYGLGEGIYIPTLQDLVAQYAPADQRGAIYAVFVGAARLGQTAGPLLAGALLTVTDGRGVFAAAAALAVGQGIFQLKGPLRNV